MGETNDPCGNELKGVGKALKGCAPKGMFERPLKVLKPLMGEGTNPPGPNEGKKPGNEGAALKGTLQGKFNMGRCLRVVRACASARGNAATAMRRRAGSTVVRGAASWREAWRPAASAADASPSARRA